ncbi:hypothetical protein [Niallia taxi]|uniref:hypothetical protein n=1 Tax=Niallia taxi TaxID=2499688 RepID=UPI0015F3F9EC|nr:hypothetical protein [Niallia taxi]
MPYQYKYNDTRRTFMELLHLFWNCDLTREEFEGRANEFNLEGIELTEIYETNPYEQEENFIEEFQEVIREYYPGYFEE